MFCLMPGLLLSRVCGPLIRFWFCFDDFDCCFGCVLNIFCCLVSLFFFFPYLHYFVWFLVVTGLFLGRYVCIDYSYLPLLVPHCFWLWKASVLKGWKNALLYHIDIRDPRSRNLSCVCSVPPSVQSRCAPSWSNLMPYIVPLFPIRNRLLQKHGRLELYVRPARGKKTLSPPSAPRASPSVSQEPPSRGLVAVPEAKAAGGGGGGCRPLDRKAWLQGQEVIRQIREKLENSHVPHRGVLKKVRDGGIGGEGGAADVAVVFIGL